MTRLAAIPTAAALGVLLGWWARGHDPGTARKVPAGHGCVTTGPWLVREIADRQSQERRAETARLFGMPDEQAPDLTAMANEVKLDLLRNGWNL